MDKETILQQLDQLKLNVETYIHGTSNVQHISSNTVQYKLNEIEKGLAPILDRIKKRVTVKTIKRQPSVESIPEFNSFQYWKIPLPDLSDNELVMFVGDTVGADAVGDQTPQLNSNIPIYEVDDLVRYHRRMHLLQQALKKDMEEDILKLEKSKKRVSRLVTGTPNRVVVNNTHNITNVITPATIILNQQPHFQQQQPVIANSTTPVVEHHHHYYGGAAPQPQTILALLSPPASHPHPNEMLAASTPKSPTSQQHQQPLAEFGNLGNRGDIDQWAGDSSTAIITPTQASLQAAKGNNVRAATSAATAFFPATTTAHSDVKPVGALQPPQTSSAAHFVDMSNAHSSGAIPPIQEMRSLGKHENKNNRSGVIATPSSTPPSAQYFNYKAYWDQHAPTTTSTPTPATTALSSATLLESSSHVQNTSAVNFGDILGENRRSSKSSSFNKALFANNNNDNDIIVMGGDGRDGGKSKKTTSKINSSLIFRLANLGRSIALAIYGTNITQTQYLNNPIFQQLHAQPLFIATLIFLWLDVVIALIKTFPTVFWVCWDVKTFDALNDDSRVWTIFALVADHDLITDLIPGILNLILKIYSYRLIEVALDPTYTTSLSGKRKGIRRFI